MRSGMFRALVCLMLAFGWLWYVGSADGASEEQPELKVGVLFSQTGTMAASERPLLRATLMGIAQVNLTGVPWVGEKSLRLHPIVRDGASDPAVFARRARELVRKHGARIILGCWTSDARKAVLSVLQKEGGLLFYPVQYEGFEDSPQCVYSGLTAQQQILPALDWLVNHGGRRIYLVGSDYVFPRLSNRLAREYLASRGGVVVGESYRPLGSKDFDKIVKEIVATKAQGVLNTINGDSLRSFFEAYRQAGISPQQVPILSTSMGEVAAAHIGEAAEGHYVASGYFMTLDSPVNRRFIKAYRKANGEKAVVDDATVTSCSQVWALAQALDRAKSPDPARLRAALKGQLGETPGGLVMDTPAGLVRYDPRNLNCWRVVRIGKALPGGQFRVVWSSELPLRPESFPTLSERATP